MPGKQRTSLSGDPRRDNARDERCGYLQEIEADQAGYKDFPFKWLSARLSFRNDCNVRIRRFPGQAVWYRHSLRKAKDLKGLIGIKYTYYLCLTEMIQRCKNQQLVEFVCPIFRFSSFNLKKV